MPILKVTEISWPSDWPRVFGQDRPLCLEIGFGDGRFLEFLAQRKPLCNVLGLEISHRSLSKAERLLHHHPNLRILHSSAELALQQLFVPGDLAEVHINFPDPWFKQSHRGRRLLRREVLQVLLNRMAPGATLQLATDVLPYAEAMAELLQNEACLSNRLSHPAAAPWSTERPFGPPTKYEQRARQAGRTCYYFAYRRDDALITEPKRIEEWPLPHLVFHSPLSLAKMQGEFQGRFTPHTMAVPPSADTAATDAVAVDAAAHLHFLAVYGADDALLFETFVREGALHQRLALLLTRQGPRAAGEEIRYTLSLSSIGHPRATPGCHWALAVMGRWLLQLHPSARVIHQRLSVWDELGKALPLDQCRP